MRASLFSFFRGTAPLFAADWAAEAPAALRTCPNAWLCGDAHLENFGTYRAKHGLVVFDLNDFDETWLGPLLYDVARLTTSARVWEEEAGVTGTGYGHCDELVGAYAAALCDGKALWIDRDIATGRIAKLMEQVYARKYADLLAKHTVVDRAVEGKQRQLAFGKRALAVTVEQRARAVATVAAFAQTTSEPPGAYDVLDVAWRVAGTGSLGLERYVVLVAGDGSADGARLIDVKQAAPSSLANLPGVKQPAWESEAARVVGGYQRMQARSPSRLGAIGAADRSFVVRRLQPVEDKLDWSDRTDLDVAALLVALGELLAWGHLRSGGRDGSAVADDLIAFGRDPAWRGPALDYAVGAASRFKEYWQTFRGS